MGLHVLLKNLSTEDRKKVYKDIDETAAKLGYALVSVPSFWIIEIGTFEDCQKTLNQYYSQDAKCGCDVGSHTHIVEVSDLHKTSVRTWFLDQMKLNILAKQAKYQNN